MADVEALSATHTQAWKDLPWKAFQRIVFRLRKRMPRVAVIEDRYERRSTIITSQLSVEHWHETLADAILDRLIHRAYRLKLEGESMRKQRAQLHESAPLRSL